MLGAVLVGGRSRRMGRDKALIRIGDEAMVDRTAALLRAAGCDPVIAVGPHHLAGAVVPIGDRHPGEGPLGAIVTALHHAAGIGAGTVLVLACDLPDLDRATLESLRTAHVSRSATPTVTVARTDRREPLVSVWDVACLAPLERRFRAGERSVHRAIDADGELRVVEVDADPLLVRNVNTPDQRWTE